MSEIPDIPFARPVVGQAEKDAVSKVLDGYMFTHGPRCKEFEDLFAQRIGVAHAVTMSSCTTALHLSILALDIGPGDEVIVPAETHVATAHAVEYCGARPIFVDVERTTGNIDPELVKAAITERTRAIMPVHYQGLPCRMDRLAQLAEPNGIAIIEDCALAIGSFFDAKAAGSFGVSGCFSFYPTKHMTTMEGGMLVTDDAAFAERVRKLRAFGYDKGLSERKVPGVYDIDVLGFNFRMSEGQAAIGVAQLDRIDGFLAQRRVNSDTLMAYIADIKNLVVFPVEDGAAQSGRFCVNVMLPEDSAIARVEVINALNEAGVGTSVHYPVALPLSKFYRNKYGYVDDQFPVARWISDSAISLPCGPHLRTGDSDYIGEALRKIMSEYS